MCPSPHPEALRQPPPPRGRRRRSSWIAAGLLALVLPAALAAGPRSVAARAMRFEHLSIEDGLSQSVVNCLLQDATGFLWLGTQDGLDRFDGYGFTVYRHDPADPASLPNNLIQALAEDPSGDLWVATEGGGLARWRRASDSFAVHRHDPADPRSLSGDKLVDLARDGEGFLWVATLTSGLNRFDPATGRFERYRHDPADAGSLASDELGALHVDRRGRLWVGTKAGLDVRDAATGRFAHHRHDPRDPGSLADERVRAILEDSRGDLWVGTAGGLHRLAGAAGGRFERYRHDPRDPASLSHPSVRDLFEDADGRLWVATDGGLDLWRPASRDFASYHPDSGDAHSLASDAILALYQDRGGVLWVGTAGAGVARWNSASWTFPLYSSADDEGAGAMVFAVSEGPDGALWIGTFGGGLERVERGGEDGAALARTLHRHDPGDPGSLADDRVTALLHDRAGTLWAGTVDGGLHRLAAGGSFVRYRHDPARPGSLSSDAVATIHEDRRGRLWIGTYGGGLELHLGDGAFLHFRHDPADPTSLADDRVLSLADDAEGWLWVATDGGGVHRFHPATGAFLRLGHDPADPASLASDEVHVVHVDPGGALWVGTEGAGLDRLAELETATGRATFEHFTVADGLPHETVWGIRSDAAGNLWLSTGDGLARLDRGSGAFTVYTTEHGLQSQEFSLGAHFASPSGELFFGGVGGVNAFFPEKISSGGAPPPPVVVTGFSRTSEPVRFARPIFDVERFDLDWRDYFFSFEVAALDFAAPQKNRYRYRLEGLDADWVDLGHRRRITLMNLDPGTYTLRLAGAGHDGAWNEAGAAVEIRVAPPPWRTWWAWTLYVLAASAALWGLARFQQGRLDSERAAAERQRRIARRERAQSRERQRLLEELERKNSELERFNYTVSHDLRSPLVTIHGFLGLLKRDAVAGDLERVDHDASRIAAAAERMRRLLDELLELSTLGRRPRPADDVPVGEVVAEALDVLAGEIAERGVEVVVAPDLPVVRGDRTRLLQLFQNLLANAVEYLGDQAEPRVEVGVREGAANGSGGCVLFVRDNGQGIEETYHDKVFGLFERLDATAGGTGVGLALAQRIVEMHGGRIWVESEGPGRGSVFCFTLAGLGEPPAGPVRSAAGVTEPSAEGCAPPDRRSEPFGSSREPTKRPAKRF